MKPKCDEPLSNFAFNFNLRRYAKAFNAMRSRLKKHQREDKVMELGMAAAKEKMDSTDEAGSVPRLFAHRGCLLTTSSSLTLPGKHWPRPPPWPLPGRSMWRALAREEDAASGGGCG